MLRLLCYIQTNHIRPTIWNSTLLIHFVHSCGLEKSKCSGSRMLNIALGVSLTFLVFSVTHLTTKNLLSPSRWAFLLMGYSFTIFLAPCCIQIITSVQLYGIQLVFLYFLLFLYTPNFLYTSRPHTHTTQTPSQGHTTYHYPTNISLIQVYQTLDLTLNHFIY